MKDPRVVFTRGIAEAVESTPAFEAMFTQDRAIPNTWGNLASQLVEEGIVEPSLEAACDFLGITPEDIQDPTLLFAGPYNDVSFFRSRSQDRWAQEYVEAHKDDDAAYLNYLKTQQEQWQISDGELRADALQTEIEHLSSKQQQEQIIAEDKYRQMGEGAPFSEKMEAYAEVEAIQDRTAPLCLKRDALSSGVIVSLDQFAEAVLSYTGDTSPSQERIMVALGSVVETLKRDYFFNNPNVQSSEIMLGQSQITEFMSSLTWQARAMARRYATAKWGSVEHLFYAGSYRKHPLFTGVHEQ